MNNHKRRFIVRALAELRRANWMVTRQEIMIAGRNGQHEQAFAMAWHAINQLERIGFAFSREFEEELSASSQV